VQFATWPTDGTLFMEVYRKGLDDGEYAQVRKLLEAAGGNECVLENTDPPLVLMRVSLRSDIGTAVSLATRAFFSVLGFPIEAQLHVVEDVTYDEHRRS
jgi:hypothetical protein